MTTPTTNKAGTVEQTDEGIAALTNPDRRPPTKVLFIGGLGRSGSTLVEKVLNELPGTVSAGETLFLWERGVQDQQRCGCGKIFGECEFWDSIGQQAFGGWNSLDVQPVIDMRYTIDRSRRFGSILSAVRKGELKPDQQRYVSYYERLLRAVADVSREANGGELPVVLESSKHVSTGALLAASTNLDVRILHVMRDPRGVAYSWTKKVERPEANGKLMPRYRPSRTAMRWVTDNMAFDVLGRSVPTYRLRYESFLADPAGELQKIADFAGIDIGTGGLSFLDGTTATLTKAMHSASGNPMRFDAGNTLTLRHDEAWRTDFTTPSKLVVSSICAPSLLRYGYPLR